MLFRSSARASVPVSFSYGTTETGTLARADRELRRRYPGCAGRLVPWIEAQAVDDEDRPVAPGRSGVLRYRGEGVAHGHFGSSASSTFRDGWCYPGDIGRVTDERIIYLEDRVDDRINLGGPKYSASAIEAALSAHPDVLEAAVLGITSAAGAIELVAAVVARHDRLDADALRRHCVSHKVAPASMRVVRVEELPRSELGKLMKAELRQRLAGRG